MKSEILFCFCLLSFASYEIAAAIQQPLSEQEENTDFPLSELIGTTLKPFSGKHKFGPVIVGYTLTDTVISRNVTGNVTYAKNETHLNIKLFNVVGTAQGNISTVTKINLLIFITKVNFTREFAIYIENSEAYVSLKLPPKGSKEFEIDKCEITNNNLRFELVQSGLIPIPGLKRISKSITKGLKDDLKNIFCKTVEKELKKEEESKVFLYVYDKVFRQ